jgi:hypothetical protein
MGANMAGEFLSRAVRRRFHAAMIWAMVPVAMMNVRSVSGCLSPTGHFEPGCHCAAMQEPGTNASQGTSTTNCCCHCACCLGKTCCCCKGKSCCSMSVAKNARQPAGNGVENGTHCRPFSMYVVAPAVKASLSAGMDHSVAIVPISFDPLTIVVTTAVAHPAELNTGPPPDNLVVALHRFLI